MSSIDIVLACFNGARYIEQQVKSIQENDRYTELVSRFIIVDDGSTDETPFIIEKMALIDKKIEFHKNNTDTKGPLSNFQYGIQFTSAEYVMLSDQDDIWLPNKIIRTIAETLILKEQQEDIPIVVFSDLKIVDDNLEEISPSYFMHKKISINWYEKFQNLVQQNVVSGCTMLINRSLIEKALPMPKDAYMHDWWLTLVAKKYGKVIFIDEPLMLYRQHASNAIGAKRLSIRSYTIDLICNIKQFENSFSKVCDQSRAFILLYEIETSDGCALTYLSTWSELNRLEKLRAIFRGRIKRSNFLSNVLLIYLALK